VSRPDGERFVWYPQQMHVTRPDPEQLQEPMREGGCEALTAAGLSPMEPASTAEESWLLRLGYI
jgi:hypothetical protein